MTRPASGTPFCRSEICDFAMFSAGILPQIFPKFKCGGFPPLQARINAPKKGKKHKNGGRRKASLVACRKSMCRLAICTKGVRLWGTPGEGCGCPVDTSAEGRSTDRADRRESPPKNSPLDCFSPLLRSFGTKISQPAGCDEGAAPQPRRLLKKAGENFSLFCYRKTVYRQTEAAFYRQLPFLPSCRDAFIRR